MTDSQYKHSLPTATYRIQLTPGKTDENNPRKNNERLNFEDVESLIPYLREMGISHVYLSPVMESQSDKSGYWTTDFNSISKELGGEGAFNHMADALHAAGIGVVVDIVPNHMRASSENVWFKDVLLNGRTSKHAHKFDIRWDESNDKVNLPTLGGMRVHLLKQNDPYERHLILQHDKVTDEVSCVFGRYEKGEDGKVKRDDSGQPVFTQYDQHRYPINDASIEENKDVNNPNETREEFVHRMNHCRAGQALLMLLDAQHYNLDQWSEGYQSNNKRRFFNVNELIGMRQENPEVFRDSHELLGRLMKEGKIDGIRIDHIDGLKYPTQYLRNLKNLIEENVQAEDLPGFYVAAEKILAPGEKLPQHWLDEGLLHGTTGYDFLNAAGKLLTAPIKNTLEGIYEEFTGENAPDPVKVVRESRLRVMEDELSPEYKRTYDALSKIATKLDPDTNKGNLSVAFKELMAAYPVYRFYPENQSYTEQEKQLIDKTFNALREAHPNLEKEFNQLQDILTFNVPEAQKSKVTDFVDNLQQFTGAMVATGTENTAFFRFNSLLRGANEVGAELGHISMTPDEFIRELEGRGTSMNVSSTHDTKMGENARLRNLALSYIPEEWQQMALAWKNHTAKAEGDIDLKDKYLLLQAIVSTYPLPLLHPEAAKKAEVDTQAEQESYISRLQEFAEKALREGKERSDYTPPGYNWEYETKVKEFVREVISDEAFLTTPLTEGGQSPLEFMRHLSQIGANVSLQNLMLKVGAPGITDIYQGGEQWLHTTVDPDNRYTPDYKELQRLHEEAKNTPINALTEQWQDGRIKQKITATLLNASTSDPDVFRDGEMVRLTVYKGGKQHEVVDDNALAFARISKEDPGNASVIFIPRAMEGKLFNKEGLGLTQEAVGDGIHIELPDSLKDVHFMDALRGGEAHKETNASGKTELVFTPEMRTLPGAVWVSKLHDAPAQGQHAS